MWNSLSDIHFSVHSVIVDDKLREEFYGWITGKSLSESDDELSENVADQEFQNKSFRFEKPHSENNYLTIDYLNSPVNPSDFPKGISWIDIMNYCEGIKYENNKLTEIELEEYRIKRIEIAENLFDRFIHEGLAKKQAKNAANREESEVNRQTVYNSNENESDNPLKIRKNQSESDSIEEIFSQILVHKNDHKPDFQKNKISLAQTVENRWNNIFNSFTPVNYDDFDLELAGFSGMLNGKPFILHEQQKKGAAFLCSKGNGLLAYDVGVGKTATGIVSVVYQMQQGKCKRPLIIVPKAVYSKWVHDTKELFPELKVNELENLNSKIVDELKINSIFQDDNDGFSDRFLDGLLIESNTISICTAEAIEKFCFDDKELEEILTPSFESLISEKRLKELFAIPSYEDWSELVFFNQLGIDLVLVDEAHRYKNLIKKADKRTYTEFINLGFGEPSARALRMFAITEYIHRLNKEKNVFFLSATPFTNSPMEIYSMLRFLGGNEIVEFGYKSINEFLNEFAEIKIEWSVNNKNEVVRKTVMKNFRSLFALQQLIQNYIDKVSADDANIKRPEKVTHVKKIQMNEIQKKIYEEEVKRISNAESLGDVFKGMNNMRMCMISPALVNQKYDNFEVPDLDKLVSSSPKLNLVCETILKVYAEKPECGQIIYLPRGIHESRALKDYLAERGIPQKAIALINSSTTENQKQKITDAFNNPENILKVLIGSESISEGVDLNGNSLVLYNCLLGWNPTEPVQVEGRLWRQGNRQKKVHIVYPLMYDSIDSLIYQKHDEKATRIDAIWNYRGDKINVEEINPQELKFDLIKDPEKKAEMVLEKDSILIKRELMIIDDSRNLIVETERRIKRVRESIKELDKEIKKLEQQKSEKAEAYDNSEDIQEAFLRLSNMLVAESENEIQRIKKQKADKELVLKQLQTKLKNKLDAVLGKNSTQEEKNEYLNMLNLKQIEIEKKIPELEKKKSFLLEKFLKEMEQQKDSIKTVEEMIEELTTHILAEE